MSTKLTEIATATGHRIRERRHAAGISQEKLAQRADISRETVRRAEIGQAIPDWSTLESLAAALGCSIPDLLDLGERCADGASCATLEPPPCLDPDITAPSLGPAC